VFRLRITQRSLTFMSVIVKPLGSLKQYIGGQNEASVEPGCSVSEALERLGIPAAIVALVLINDAPRDKEYVLQESDVVKLLAVIGGG
jgi:sulfur carrier protein ThiS